MNRQTDDLQLQLRVMKKGYKEKIKRIRQKINKMARENPELQKHLEAVGYYTK